MNVLLYLCWVTGVVLLIADLAGRLTVSPEHIRRWRTVGVVAGAGPGLAPPLEFLAYRLDYSSDLLFPTIAAGYLVAYLIFVVGVSGIGGRSSLWLRRVGYAGLLALASLPSWVLLLLTPLVLIAGVGLVRPQLRVRAIGPEDFAAGAVVGVSES